MAEREYQACMGEYQACSHGGAGDVGARRCRQRTRTAHSHSTQPQHAAAAQSHSTQPPHTATAHSHSTQPQRTATARTRRTQPQYTATARRHLHLHVRPVPVMRKAIATVDSEDHEQRTVAGDNHVVLVGALMTQTSDCIGLHMIAGSNAHPISMGTK